MSRLRHRYHINNARNNGYPIRRKKAGSGRKSIHKRMPKRIQPSPIKNSPHLNKVKTYSTSAAEKMANAKDVVKPKTTRFLPKLNVKNMMDKFRGLSTRTKYTIGVAGAIAGAMFVKNIFERTWGAFKSIGKPSRMLYDNENTYLPDKYERGYDAIQEHLTAFGSRIHLDKATNNRLNKSYSSIRNGVVTTVNAKINANHALNAHKNAISHHHY